MIDKTIKPNNTKVYISDLQSENNYARYLLSPLSLHLILILICSPPTDDIEVGETNPRSPFVRPIQGAFVFMACMYCIAIGFTIKAVMQISIFTACKFSMGLNLVKKLISLLESTPPTSGQQVDRKRARRLLQQTLIGPIIFAIA